MTEPTLAEVARRLDSITSQLTSLIARLDNDRVLATQTFLHRETYNSDERLRDALHKSLRTDVDALEKARTNDQNWRRQQSFTLAVTATGWLLTIALALFAFISR